MAKSATAKKISSDEKVIHIGSPPTNDGKFAIDFSQPYQVDIRVEGVADLLFHRYSVEAVEETAKAAKNSKTKKTDNLESYVWRNAEGELCLPSEYLRRAVVLAAKFKQDPRSPRKSAMDLVNASVIALSPLATLGKREWDYLDKRRVLVQRQGVTRVRPGIFTGWKAEFQFAVLSPEYIDIVFLRELLNTAGKLIGVGDFRPSYGRFHVTHIEPVQNM